MADPRWETLADILIRHSTTLKAGETLLVECFDLETNTCPIAPACGLKGALHRAQMAFLEVLDEYTLDDFRLRRPDLIVLLDANRNRQAEAVTDVADAG